MNQKVWIREFNLWFIAFMKFLILGGKKMFRTIRENNLRYRFFLIFLITLGSTCSSGVPYLVRTYYNIFQNSTGMTHEQLGFLLSMFGLGSMILYLPGGWMADRFSPRRLIAISYIGSACLSAVMLTMPSFAVMCVLYLAYAIFNIFTLWAAETKIVRVMGTEEEQGKMQGFREALAGLGGVLVGFTVLFIGAQLPTEEATLYVLILFYMALGLICGVLLFLMLDDSSQNVASDQPKLKDIFIVAKNPKVWMVALIVFACYTLFSAISYLSPYLVDTYGISDDMGAAFGVIRQYGVRIFMCSLLGLLADRIGSVNRVIRGSVFIILLHTLVYIFLPGSPSTKMVAIVLMLTMTCVANGLRGLYYAQMAENRFPIKQTGSIIGFIAFVGYLPDVFFYTMVGGWIDKYGALGYRYMFMYCAAVCVFCILICTILYRMNKKDVRTAIATE